MGIKDLLPAYLNPSLQTQDLVTGVNFASGGARYDPLKSDIALVFSLSDQLTMFKEYIMKLKEVVGEERISKILRESLVIVATGEMILSIHILALLCENSFTTFLHMLI
ncbi:GDSL esterase/lipase At1g20120 [Olea europaea subsp. europaea]|uniref:GDSL esterase/lipase At1g20120 n=2 Tax=Olea europaea subsp. europaea TaxID=158383 RepID=A0A8S0UN30_OLEEU|nr:GDSL esterase/lipase At1g20120 [Olea europaea subsp. europaea]